MEDVELVLGERQAVPAKHLLQRHVHQAAFVDGRAGHVEHGQLNAARLERPWLLRRHDGRESERPERRPHTSKHVRARL